VREETRRQAMRADSALQRQLAVAAFLASLYTVLTASVSLCFDVQETWAEWLLLSTLGTDVFLLYDASLRARSAFHWLGAGAVWHEEADPARCLWHYARSEWLFAALNEAIELAVQLRLSTTRFRFPRADPAHAVARPAAGWLYLDVATAIPCELLLSTVRAPPPPRTKWTRRVRHPVLIGHAASLSQVRLLARGTVPAHFYLVSRGEVRPLRGRAATRPHAPAVDRSGSKGARPARCSPSTGTLRATTCARSRGSALGACWARPPSQRASRPPARARPRPAGAAPPRRRLCRAILP
jgi:hypothetical protein